MAISLQKGQRVDLTKSNPGLTKLLVGLGWDPAKGLLGFGSGSNIDCDSFIVCLNQNGKEEETVWFRNLRNRNGSVVLNGDNVTGEGDGDDEQIEINLSFIPTEVEKLVIGINIYDCVSRRQDFGKIKRAFVHLDDAANGKELVRYDISNDYKGYTSLIVGELYRSNGEWKFAAIGEGTKDTSISQIKARY